MKFNTISVSNFDGALRGMRNPLASWDKSDSVFGLKYYDDLPDYEVAYSWVEYEYPELDPEGNVFCDKQDLYAEWVRNNGIFKFDEKSEYAEYGFIGPKDMQLATRLCAGGPEHRKFLRQIQICVDITAPIYWWKEFDTYKVGTTANSTSTMHKLASTPITLDCFELDDYCAYQLLAFDNDQVSMDTDIKDFLNILDTIRQKYNETKDKRYWKELVRWLPCGWLQTRTVTMNYENVRTICGQRAGHKLTEWHQFVDWAHTLPYSSQLIFGEKVALD